MNIFLTGATGFIGKALLEELLKRNNKVIAAVRGVATTLPENVSKAKLNDIFELENTQMMQGVDTVIHCAARAHVLREHTTDPLIEFRKTNTIGTLNLAKQAIAAGVKRFIFLSSIGVNGRSTTKAFTEDDVPSPDQDYAISKLEAENGLQKLASISGMEVVILRPPLVYGPNAPGNFGRLIKWLDKNIPLPLGAIYNKRSFVALDNLVDLIVTCIEHPAAANQVFLVSDGKDLSTTEFLNFISSALGKQSRLFPINQKILEFFLILFGKKDLAQQLCGSLQVDISKAKRLLNWTPIISVDEGIRKTAEHFLSYNQNNEYP